MNGYRRVTAKCVRSNSHTILRPPSAKLDFFSRLPLRIGPTKAKLRASQTARLSADAKSGRLLLIWATLVRGVYVEAVAYSDNGRLDGNWIHDTELLFDKNGGHGMIFTSFDGDLYFILHAPNSAPDERPVLIPIVEHDGKLFFRSEDSV